MFKILTPEQIPYTDQASRLFNLTAGQLSTNGIQRIVPFLGAGVSTSGRPPARGVTVNGLETADFGPIFQQLGLDGRAKDFLEMAILLAYLMQSSEKSDGEGSRQTAGETPISRPLRAVDADLLIRLQQDAYPPSAGELAKLFSQLSNYSTFKNIIKRLRRKFPGYNFAATEQDQVESFKLLANVSGVANPPDLLSSITSYFESIGDRDSLWENLSSIIAPKNTPTETHKLLAKSARHHFALKRAIDYLIITTNYDCLMERALDDLGVPYVVLLTRKNDQKVVVRFSEKIPDYEWLEELNKGDVDGTAANGFVLQRGGGLGSVVVIYKIHGCVSPKLKRHDGDGVIISDNDYVSYIKQMGKGNNFIPSNVNTLMNNKPFIFLGYSLSDWNIRSIFETMREKRSQFKGVQDFSVMYDVGEFEEVFFQRNDILIFQTDLNSFADRVISALPDDIRASVLQ